MQASPISTHNSDAPALDPWRLGAAPENYDLVDIRALTPAGVVDDARIVVRDGLIQEVGSRPSGSRGSVHGNNALVLPGLVDTHSDALEKERLPRPNAPVPWAFAMASLEGKFAAAGVTTTFHGAAFQHQTYRGGARDLESVDQVCRVVDAAPKKRVDHHVLHRLDVLSGPGADRLARRLAETTDPVTPLVSHEDHTPGQGQYADPTYMVNYIMGADGRTEAEALADVDRLIREGQEQAPVRAANLAWLGELARDGRIRLAGHDIDSPEGADELHARGGTVAEFPTTLSAARRARELGMTIVAGAPNLLRGGSHAGNISAAELLGAGLLDALASDYLPSALLSAVWQCVRQGQIDLPRAIALVTSGPARVAGLDDRGSLTPGLRADLALVDDTHGDWPSVSATLRSPVGGAAHTREDAS